MEHLSLVLKSRLRQHDKERQTCTQRCRTHGSELVTVDAYMEDFESNDHHEFPRKLREEGTQGRGQGKDLVILYECCVFRKL